MAELVNVTIPCVCPETPHEEDTVSLRPVLGLAAGISIERAVRDFLLASGRRNEDAILGTLVEYYVLHGVAAWTLVDEKGRAIEPTPEAIAEHLLSDYSIAKPIADRADDLYKEKVIGPLLSRGGSSSLTTSRNGGTSATHAPTPKPRKRSKPSSTSTTPMAGTETTTQPPDGGSSS